MMLNSDARERVLDAAEKLFAERGYRAVTLKDIAAAIGIRHASLYHHVPGGKQELFIEVTERNLARHRAGIAAAAAACPEDIRAQLKAVARWLIDQPPMDLIRMVNSDMPAIDPKEAWRLSKLASEAMIEPLHDLLKGAQARGEIDHDDLGVIAGGLLGMIESLHAVPTDVRDQHGKPLDRHYMASRLIDALLDGLMRRVKQPT
jgi:AcrR family transcriptional regulator